MSHSYPQLDKQGIGRRYGVYVAGLGVEVGDENRWVVFTHDVRRGIAAVLADVRREWGGRVQSLKLEKAGWWMLRDNCGCGDTCPHGEEMSCWDDEDGLCDPQLPPCGDTYAWIGESCTPETSGAVPVRVFEVEMR